jgi:hypothetical protein
MDGAQFAAVMDGNPTMEDLDEMVAEKRRQSEEENRARAKAEEDRNGSRPSWSFFMRRDSPPDLAPIRHKV